MSPEKLQVVRQIVESSPPTTMGTLKGRKELAARLATSLNKWDNFCLQFVEEMRGLSFSIDEERELFIQFADLGL